MMAWYVFGLVNTIYTCEKLLIRDFHHLLMSLSSISLYTIVDRQIVPGINGPGVLEGGSGLEQDLEYLLVAVNRSPHEHRDVVLVPHFRICFVRQQYRYSLLTAILSSSRERCGAG